jgi:hypothetical protein
MSNMCSGVSSPRTFVRWSPDSRNGLRVFGSAPKVGPWPRYGGSGWPGFGPRPDPPTGANDTFVILRGRDHVATPKAGHIPATWKVGHM